MSTEIKLTHYDMKAEVTLAPDADLHEVLMAFQGIAIAAGWHNDSWEQVIIDLAKDYNKNQD